MKYAQVASEIIELVGGKDNINSVSHCMTRLRFSLKDVKLAQGENLKRHESVVGVVYKGGQYQVIIGPDVSSVYDELIKIIPGLSGNREPEPVADEEKEPLTLKSGFNNVMGALAACMTPLIPIMLCAGFSKTIAAIFGPSLLGWIDESSSLYILFTFVGDTGFYFIPVFAGYTAAKRFGVNVVMGLFMGAILIHPTLIQMAADGASLSVYGIPAGVNNYTSTIIPIILTMWVTSYVERFFKKHTPNALKVFGIPFGTLLVMLPIMLCLLAPLGSYIGNYVGNGLIALYDVAGPIAVAVLGATFALIVMTGMHAVLFTFLFVSFPLLGYDAFIIPAMILASWAGGGVALACVLKFKDTKKKSLVIGYIITWLLGGVGEPLLYGLNVPYRTPLYAGIVSGFFAGLVGGLLGLKAYVLSPSNGIYGLAAFFGGPQSNYTVLLISIAASVVIGFVVMWFMKLDETLA